MVVNTASDAFRRRQYLVTGRDLLPHTDAGGGGKVHLSALRAISSRISAMSAGSGSGNSTSPA
jgi:hypothetical protein